MLYNLQLFLLTESSFPIHENLSIKNSAKNFRDLLQTGVVFLQMAYQEEWANLKVFKILGEFKMDPSEFFFGSCPPEAKPPGR